VKTYTVGQLASSVGMSVEAVRFYEREGLLDQASRNVSGYRVFPASAVERLKFINRGKHFGFTLTEIKNLLAIWTQPSSTHEAICQAVDGKVADLDAKAHELLEKAQSLKQLCSACRMNALAQECPIMRALAGGESEGGQIPADVPTSARCRANHGPYPEGHDGTRGGPMDSGGGKV
jgi:DNA-binding transcriptional MerR regulator